MIRRTEEEAKGVAGTALRSLCKHRAQPVVEFLGHHDTLFHFDAGSLAKATHHINNPRWVKSLKDTRRRLQKTGLAPDTPSAALEPPVFAVAAEPISESMPTVTMAMSAAMIGDTSGAPMYSLGVESTDPLHVVGMEIGQEVELVEHLTEHGMGEVHVQGESEGVHIQEAERAHDNGEEEEIVMEEGDVAMEGEDYDEGDEGATGETESSSHGD